MDPISELPPPAESPARLRGLAGGLGLLALLTVATALGTLQGIGRQGRSSDWVNHTHAVMMEGNELLTALHATEAAIRGYALSATLADRVAAQDAAQAVEEHAQVLLTLTAAEPAQAAMAARLERLLSQRRTLLLALLDASAQDSAPLLHRLLGGDRSLPSLGEIRREVEKLQELLQAQLVAHDAANFRQARDRRWSALTGLFLNFALLGASAWLIRSDVVNRRRIIAHFQTQNRLLGERVQQQLQAVRAAHDRLETETLEQQWSLQALNHQIKYNRAIFDAVSEPVLVITKAGNISRANPATLRLTGQTEETLLNRPLASLVRFEPDAADDPPIGQRLTAALAAGHEIRDRRAVLVDDDQAADPLQFDLYPIRDGDQVVGAVVLLRPLLSV